MVGDRNGLGRVFVKESLVAGTSGELDDVADKKTVCKLGKMSSKAGEGLHVPRLLRR